jgi:hypothetical protein
MTSSVPADSPAPTREQNSWSKWRGYLARDRARPEPAATSFLIVVTSSFIDGFSRPSVTMSKLCTRGTPAFIMVASWRVNTAMSEALIGFLRAPNRGFGLRRTDRGLIPFWRSWARAMACDGALISPLV